MSLSKAYDRWHERVFEADPSHADESSPWYRLVLEYLQPVESKRVLEVACGRGGFVKLLASRGATVWGSDFSIGALRIGRQKTQANGGTAGRVALVQADAHHLPYADSSFDVIVSCETIEHLVDPEMAMQEMARVCRPNGLLYLTTPNYANLMGLYNVYAFLRRRKTESDFTQPLDRRYLFFQIRGFVRRAGWEILYSDGTVHPLPVPRRSPVPLLFLESNRLVRRCLSPLAFHYFLLGRKRGSGR